MSGENPNQVHGRLLEALHNAGYSFERAWQKLEWLLEEERWKKVGDGYDNINTFMGTVRLPSGITTEQRKSVAKRIKELEPDTSQRKIAGVLGVSHTTVQNDSDGKKLPRKRRLYVRTDELVGNNLPLEPDGAEVAKNAHKLVTENGNVVPMSGDYEWYTPKKYVKLIYRVLGRIDLDPASCDEANLIVGATDYYTKADDGLSQSWWGKVFCNPPYDSKNAKEFTIKLIAEIDVGNVEQAIYLTNNSTDTEWGQLLLKRAQSICFTKGRIDFVNANEKDVGSTNRQGQMFSYFGKNKEMFESVFSEIGKTR